jgi:uncharacterized membrane protein YkoI
MITKRAIISGVFLGFTALFISAGSAMATTQTDVKIGISAEKSAISVQKSLDVDFTQVAQRQISASQAKSIAMSRVPGGQYIDLRKSGNTYIVRIRDRNGRVRDIRIDATTGRVK